MKKQTLFAALAAVFCLAAAPAPCPAQDAKTKLFAEADRSLSEAQALNAAFFSPVQYAQAEDWYKKADADFQAGRNMEDLQKKIKMAAVYFAKAAETAREAKTVFKDCIKARGDALLVEAPALRKALWDEAEAVLAQASKGLEDGDASGARNKSRKAEVVYRRAELESIKANYLDGTRTLLKESEAKDVKKRAPKTLAKATDLANRAESQLVENRYDTDEARQLAQEAQYEARHALYLNETVSALEKSKATLESILLDAEAPVRKIADAFDLNARFDAGADAPVSAVLSEIRKRDQAILAQAQEIREKSEQLEALRAQVARMETQLGDLKSKEASLAQEMDRLLEEQRLAREKMERIEKRFTPEQPQILGSGSEVVLRLYSITFPVGKAVIEPKYFGLLAKVSESFSEYENAKITVQGHTDSRGSDEANMKLSTERAEAVREYLLATGGVDAGRLDAVGYGESNPIASNDTEEGRRKNRRIDIVITPNP